MDRKFPLPPLPWHCNHHAISGLPADDVVPSVHDADGGLVVIVQPGLHAVGDLFALAPELLRELGGLMRAVLQLDPAYCRTHGLHHDPDALRIAASEAVAVLAHAKQIGLPVDVPGLLDDLEEV